MVFSSQGILMVNKIQSNTHPVDFNEGNVMNASKVILDRLKENNTEHILKVKHLVNMVPIAVVIYDYKEKEGNFFIYGIDKQIDFDDYPTKCCCCSII